MTMDDTRKGILGLTRETFGRVVYSHKTHEVERERWSKIKQRINWVVVGIAFVTTTFAVISVAMPQRWVLIATALFAAAGVALTMSQAFFDPQAREYSHRTAAKELLCLREHFCLLVARCYDEAESNADLQKRLEALIRELTAVYKFAPDTSFQCYNEASARLTSGEATFSDAEIDAFLPTHLRST